MHSAKAIIEHLDLLKHPEGGYYREVYRSTGVIPEASLGTAYEGDRNYATSIYFLLTAANFSAFHKINQDETWHFYLGAPITIHSIAPDGHYTKTVLHNTMETGFHLQYTVDGGSWFAAEVTTPESYALVGCTVAPGFDFKDFKLAQKEALLREFPQHEALISRLSIKES